MASTFGGMMVMTADGDSNVSEELQAQGRLLTLLSACSRYLREVEPFAAEISDRDEGMVQNLTNLLAMNIINITKADYEALDMDIAALADNLGFEIMGLSVEKEGDL